MNEKIGEGGFGTIYKACWLDGIPEYENIGSQDIIRRNKDVAIKKLLYSKEISKEFLNE
ncbi:11257_t:CDS:2, partial [Funneliformis geosporum]